MTVILTPEQNAALAKIAELLDSGQRVVRVGGMAGTGKTTMVSSLAQWPGVLMTAPTNKACSVLKSKAGVDVKTLHSLLYQPYEEISHVEGCRYSSVRVNDLDRLLAEDEEYQTADTAYQRNEIIQRYQPCPCPLEPRFRLREDEGDVRIVIVDEASMVSSVVFNDLVGTGAQIVLVGDYAQLPPVKDTFMALGESSLDVKLTTIHRQVADNPIIRLAHSVRSRGTLPPGTQVDSWSMLRKSARLDPAQLPLLLCYTNKRRVTLNSWCRQALGREGNLCEGDRLLCVQNDKGTELFNGTLWTVTKVGKELRDSRWVEAESDYGNTWAGPVNLEQLGAEQTFDRLRKGRGHQFMYGYALTVHKAQGSEADRVILFLEASARNRLGNDYPRWLYTGVTRARSSLRLVNA